MPRYAEKRAERQAESNAEGHANADYAGNDYEEEAEAEAESTPFPMWKTVAVAVVVIGCFAAVYPKMFHPMILYALGLSQPQKAQSADNMQAHAHPPMGNNGHGLPTNGPRQQQQGFPHPAHRMGPMPGMGAAMHQAGEAGKGGSKAMWHWMLPFYTIGVILFLLYTLSKILWKKPKATTKRFNLRYNSSRDRFETNAGQLESSDEDKDEPTELYDDEGQRYDSARNLNNHQLKNLQRRLRETETAMHSILSQLEKLSTTADATAAEDIRNLTMETLNNLGHLAETNNSANNKRRPGRPVEGGSSYFEPTETRYINDLEKALADFKRFTENYIQEHSSQNRQETKSSPTAETGKQMSDSKDNVTNGINDDDDGGRSSSSNGEESRQEQHVSVGCDLMEADQQIEREDLKVEPGDGEIILLSESNTNSEHVAQGETLDKENMEPNYVEQIASKGKQRARQRKRRKE